MWPYDVDNQKPSKKKVKKRLDTPERVLCILHTIENLLRCVPSVRDIVLMLQVTWVVRVKG